MLLHSGAARGKVIPCLLGLVLLLGVYLRFVHLSAQPYWMDEGYTTLAALALQEKGFQLDGHARLDSGETYWCPLYCYPTAAWATLIGATPGATAAPYRALAGVFGAAFVLVAYLCGRAFFQDRRVAALGAGLVSLSYWQIAWSRQARWYTELAVFFWLALYFFYRFLRAKTKRAQALNLAGAAACTLLAIATHKLALLLPIVMAVWAGVLLNRQILRWRFGIAALVGVAVIALTELVGPSFVGTWLGKLEWHYMLPYYLGFYLRTYWPLAGLAVFAMFLVGDKAGRESRGASERPSPDSTQASPSPLPHGQGPKPALVALLLFAPFLVYLAALAFLTDIVHYRYLFHTTLAFFLAAAWAIVTIYDRFHDRRMRWVFVLSLLSIALITNTIIIWPQKFYYLEADDPNRLGPRPHYAYTPQPDWNAAYAYVKAHRQPDDIVVSTHPAFTKIFMGEPGYWLAHDYLGLRKRPIAGGTKWEDYYVGAATLHDLADLRAALDGRSGFIVVEGLDLPGKMDEAVRAYLQTDLHPAFEAKQNAYSGVWVFRKE